MSPSPTERLEFAAVAALAVLLLLLALLAPVALAEELAPDALIKSITAEVTAAIRQDPATSWRPFTSGYTATLGASLAEAAAKATAAAT
ncbi:MAG TPA: hypothetical protein VEV21_02185 [Burkholderiales bacterium]|nr:hypothetical protein [Burkholderiales bacterium]